MSRGESATPLARSADSGSAHHGGHHWLGRAVHQRRSAAAVAVADLLADHASGRSTAAPSGNGSARLGARSRWRCSIITAFKHGLDGLKVAVDDYVHDDGNRIGLHFCSQHGRHRRRGDRACSRWPRSLFGAA